MNAIKFDQPLKTGLVAFGGSCIFLGIILSRVPTRTTFSGWVKTIALAMIGGALVTFLLYEAFEIGHRLAQGSSLTPTNTPSPSPIFTPSSTPTPSLTPTLTLTQTPTPTLTPTPTPTLTPTPTPTLTPTPTPQCKPHAKIIKPRDGETIEGDVDIIGTADPPVLERYKLEYRAEWDGLWRLIVEMKESKTYSKLGIWQTGGLPNGAYRLRLLTVDRTGNYPNEYTCEIRVMVKNP